MTLALTIIKSIIGWVYFICWSLSFYPQVYLNFKKKNCLGLSYDFLFFNFTGYFAYSIFNGVLYWDKVVQNEYLDKYAPPIPVHPSDVAFSVHAFILNFIIISQCFIYRKNIIKHDQKISKIGGVIGGCLWLSMIIVTILGFADVVTWLFVIYYMSYVKLVITFIKYVPQAYANYKNKNTTGWSIESVLLDISGGFLSIVEMFLDVKQSGNWNVFTGDPVKLGLSLFSIGFDIIFIIQHYVLYRHNNKMKHNNQIHNTVNKDNDQSYNNVVNQIKLKQIQNENETNNNTIINHNNHNNKNNNNNNIDDIEKQ